MKTNVAISNTVKEAVEDICKKAGKTTEEFIEEAVRMHIDKVSRELPCFDKRDDELWGRAIDACKRCLELKGYEILSIEYDVADIVAEAEDGTICFIYVQVSRGVDEEEMPQRSAMERAAFHFMCENELDDGAKVRFDNMTLMVVGKKAMVRHHLAAYDEKEVA